MPIKDLTGQVFNALTAISFDRIENKRAFWWCECTCGRKKSLRSDHIQSGNTKSCNECDWVQIDITGEKYGMLTVVRFLKKDPDKQNATVWLCMCDCGNEAEVFIGPLRTGNVKSCGCLWHQKADKSYRWKGHGSIPSTYWSEILSGAYKRNLSFDITIEYADSLWTQQEGLCALTEHLLDMKVGSRTASLDRIDSSHGYIVGNVQWVHKDINRSKNVFSQEYYIQMCEEVAALAQKKRGQ